MGWRSDLTRDRPDATTGDGRDILTPAEPLEDKYPPRPQRVDLEIPVLLRSRAGIRPGLVKNICSGGLFVSTARLLAVGDWVVLRLTIPGATEAVEKSWARFVGRARSKTWSTSPAD